jgi:hypothetical protein
MTEERWMVKRSVGRGESEGGGGDGGVEVEVLVLECIYQDGRYGGG